ncbi:MAG: ABC transporter ATP-binding protein [Rhodothermales bacterium]|nr:ABC transporter ATP-binding protein [Rhodothermales bacterium]
MATAEVQKKPTDMARAWREARELMWNYRGRLAIGFALMIVNRLAGLVLPGSSKFLVDSIVGEGQHDLLMPLALAVGVATAFQAVTTYALSQVISVAAQHAIMEMRERVQSHVIHLPIRFFDDTKSGTLISRVMSDPEGIRNLVGTGIIQLVGGIFTAIIALGVLLYLNWSLTVITIVVLAVFGTGMAIAFRRLRPIFRERNVIRSDVTGRLGETLSGIRIVKAYGVEDREEGVFSSGVKKLFDNIASSITGVSAITAFGTLIIGVVGVIMIAVGGRAITSGTMTLGDFVMYIFFTGLLAAPIVRIANIGTQISEAFAGLDRIRELFDEITDDAEDASKSELGSIKGDISFDDVVFSYKEGLPVLKGISFDAAAGTTTALVGSSGSGKSTLVSLVLSFNNPDSGSVLIDGRDLSQIKVADYRKTIGVVLQENFLFDGTVAENVRFTKPDATDEEVIAASKVAHCHEFVSAFPDGYETIVGERGVKLSGGQRQRIAIARAILADCKILVLDEATSSLDSESEALIQEGLKSLRQGRTTFVIAHRLSTIRSADQILVIEDGKIVESGNHDSLYASGGRYRELHDQQYAWESDIFINPGEDYATQVQN